MERDLAILIEAEGGVVGCRIYGWKGVWITLGRFQSPDDALVDPSECNWIVRPSGGGAVLHGHDVTVGLAVPMRRSIRGTYRIVTRPLIEALNTAGVSAILAEDIQASQFRTTGPDCFAAISANDVIDPSNHRKVCGCALRRTGRAVLLQASIPIRNPLERPDRLIKAAVAPHLNALDYRTFISTLRINMERFSSSW